MSDGTFEDVRARDEDIASRLARRAQASAANAAHCIWIERLDPVATAGHAPAGAAVGPLAGLSFAIKDNIDLAGVPTTAGCPAYAYTPEASATVVQRLLDAGALPLGKTNLDQFATGLVGTRSPYGECRNAIDPERISGGSSAGSAVAVALGEADFSLGTDTAGSGRIPAAFNGLVGMKPSRGLVPNTGVVPACRSLDCVTTFTRNVADAASLLAVIAGADGVDPACRSLAARFPRNRPRVGVPDTHRLGFADPAWGPDEFDGARVRLESLGYEVVAIDPQPFIRAGDLLYGGPWVAERAVAVGAFIAAHRDEVHPVTAAIIDGADAIDSISTFRGLDALRELALEAAVVFDQVDAVMMPTADRFPTIAEVLADPIGVNTALGRYTNFMNLLDYAAVAVPAGVNAAGLPFGVTMFAPAGSDLALLELAATFNGEAWQAERGYPLVVAGAHMDGLPLNWQLRERGGRLVRPCRTASGYRLYALPGGPPERPALISDPSSETAIEVELWDLPEANIGSLLAGIPAPLALGRVRLDDGTTAVGFVGGAGSEHDALDITAHGGWRGWIASRAAAAE